jgi:hypothetical protein
MLGVFDTVASRLTDVRFRLAPGDLLLFYTDGACEARPNPAGPGPRRETFNDAALARALAATHGLAAAATITAIAATQADHPGGWASDDIALLALRVPPPPGAHLTLPAAVNGGMPCTGNPDKAGARGRVTMMADGCVHPGVHSHPPS